jgi:hypothetical protein
MTREPLINSQSDAYREAGSLVPSRSTVLILAIALITRLLTVWSFVTNHPRNWLFSHPYEMGLLANSLLHGLGYSSPFGGNTGPTAFIAPGYPTLIAGVFFVFGTYTFASAIAIMVMQVLVNVLTIWLMMHVARQMLDSRTAIVAGVFWAISPPLLFIPVIFWETSFSACFLLGMIALAIQCRRKPTKAAWVLLGACCGITALINPALLPSLLAIMGWVAFETRRISRTAPAIGLLALLLVFSPWPIRNAYRFHAFIPLRSTVGFEMYMGNRPGATGRLDESLFPMFNKPELASYLAKGEVAYTRDKSVQAWGYIRTQPGIFLKLSLKRAYRFWTGTGNIDGLRIYEIHALITTVLGFSALVLLCRQRKRAFAVLIALPLLLFPFPYYITHAEFRYRLNIDPLLTILAAYAATQFITAWSRRSAARKAAEESRVASLVAH